MILFSIIDKECFPVVAVLLLKAEELAFITPL